MSSKAWGLIWLIVALAFAGLAAGAIPKLSKYIPFSVEERLGQIVGGFDRLRVCRSPEGLEKLGILVRRLYPLEIDLHEADAKKLPLTVQVVAGEEINAFAFLGGNIYIYDGLLQEAQSADEVAGVLAHEMAHVTKRHIIQNVITRVIGFVLLNFVGAGDSSLPDTLLQMRFSRAMEAQADDEGLHRLEVARIDVKGYQRFFERASHSKSIPAILSDHPSHADRIKMIEQIHIKNPQPVLTPQEFLKLKAICRNV